MKNLYLLLSVFICGTLFSQTTHTIDNSPSSGAQFTTLQTAIDAASIGDTLYVHPSLVSYGDVDLNKTLHLRGLAHSAEIGTNFYAQIGEITLNAAFGAPGITIEGLRINKVKVTGSVNYNNAIIKNCRIGHSINVGSTTAQCNNWIVSGNVILSPSLGFVNKANHDTWVFINNYIRMTANVQDWYTVVGFDSSDLIRNNIFVFEQNTGAINLCNDCESALFENCLLLFNGVSLSFTDPVSEVSFSHCLSYNYQGGTAADLNGNDNIDNTNPMFINASNPIFSYDKDFHIESGTAAYSAGTDGGQLGIFGGDYSFSMQGYPDDLPYPVFMEISNSVISQGGTLNVSFQAESN